MLPVLLLLACTDGKDTAVDDTDTVETDTERDTWESAVPLEDFTGLFGSVVFTQYLPDPEAEETLYDASAIFADDADGILNGAQCLLAGDAPCITAFGDADGEATVWAGGEFTPATFDVGDPLRVGGVDFEVQSGGGATAYVASPSGWDLGADLSLDGDFAPYSGTDLFEWATPLVPTSPDPTQRVALTDQTTLDFAWTPGGTGEIYLRYGEGMLHLTDDGAYTFDLTRFELKAPVDGRIVMLARTTDAAVDAAGNAVRIMTSSEQWYYLDYKNVDGYTELLEGTHVGEDCGAALALAAVPAGLYYGSSVGDENDYNLGNGNPATDYATEGGEEVLRVDLLAGQTLRAELRHPWADASLYLLDADCDTDDPLTGADATLTNEVEEIDYTATSDQTVLLVVDSYDPGGRDYALTFTVQ